MSCTFCATWINWIQLRNAPTGRMQAIRSKMPTTGNLVLHMSPWLIAALALILVVFVGISAWQNSQREREIMTRNLLDRARALILAVEAGTRAGMGLHMGMPYLQTLVEETAKQPGIISMMVTDDQGRVRAHSHKDLIGQPFNGIEGIERLSPGDEPKWRIRKEAGGKSVFEVYESFNPLSASHGRMMRMPGMDLGQPPSDRSVIAVGLDISPYEEAMEQDVRHSVVMALLFALVAFGGAVSIFWLQHFRLSRRLLQDTQAFASEVVKCLPVGLLTTDPQGKVNLVNAAAVDILGQDREHLEGVAFAHLNASDWKRILEDVQNGQTVLEKEVSLQHSERKSQPVSVSASQIINEEGKHLGNLFIVRSLTEVRELQERLRRSERLSAIGNLAAGVAHEIRNPLSSIRGFASLLAEHLHDDPEQESALIMIQEVDRLNRVVSELLEFARPTAVRLMESDLNAIVLHALRLVESEMAAKGLTFEFEADPALPYVLLDPERMTQALLNLILNAIQAMKAGGVLTIEAEPADGGVRISVTDTGHGMSREDMANIFNPYFTTKSTGSGLGLAIVHRIVESHHGEISVESQIGKHTRFTLFLPTGIPSSQGEA